MANPASSGRLRPLACAAVWLAACSISGPSPKKSGAAKSEADAQPVDAAVDAVVADSESDETAAAEVANAPDVLIFDVPPGPACFLSSDCPATFATCAQPLCLAGHCALGAAPEGTSCVATGCDAKGICSAGKCAAVSPFPIHTWPSSEAITARALCATYYGGARVVGSVQTATSPGRSGWMGTWHNGKLSSTLWPGGYEVSFEACRGGQFYGEVVGWRKTGDQGERDSLYVKLDASGAGVMKVHDLGVPGDDQLTAIQPFGKFNFSASAAGEVWSEVTGVDARFVYEAADGKLLTATYALPGDQYVRGITEQDADSAFLCGFQAKDGAAADAWLARIDPKGVLLWQTAVGDSHVQRLNACRVASGTVVAVGLTQVTLSGEEVPQAWAIALDAATGAVKWQHTMRSSFTSDQFVGLDRQVWSGGWLASGRSDGQASVTLFNADGWPLSVRRFSGQGMAIGVLGQYLVQGGETNTTVALAPWPPSSGAAVVDTNTLGGDDCSSLGATACSAKPCTLLTGSACLTEQAELGTLCALGADSGFCGFDGTCQAAKAP